VQISECAAIGLDQLRIEVEIMKKLSHKNIITLHEIFESQDYFEIVMEYFPGGDLYSKITSSDYSYDESDSALIIRQILEAVSYMHRNNIAHRDLKPENILYNEDKKIKVIDFGLSKNFIRSEMKTTCGTTEYCAPEVFTGNEYNSLVDVWSTGVICYVLLCGFSPFSALSRFELIENVISIKYSFPSPEWDLVSEEAKNFISRLLVEHKIRPVAADCLSLEWIAKKAPKETRRSPEERNLIRSRLIEYDSKRKNQRY